MMKSPIKPFLALAAFMLATATLDPAVGAASPLGKTYYTRANIWYERPDQIYSTNYHRGAILPAGTKVTVNRYLTSGRYPQISFTVDEVGLTFNYLQVKRHSTITLQELFDRYFSEENVMAAGGLFSTFTPEEQKNIRQGTITPGMTRPATLMAWGYPPSHLTPLLTAHIWTYWSSRMRKVLVFFNADRIIKIEK